MKLLGLVMALLGWLIPVAALTMTQSTAARMVASAVDQMASGSCSTHPGAG